MTSWLPNQPNWPNPFEGFGIYLSFAKFQVCKLINWHDDDGWNIYIIFVSIQLFISLGNWMHYNTSVTPVTHEHFYSINRKFWFHRPPDKLVQKFIILSYRGVSSLFPFYASIRYYQNVFRYYLFSKAMCFISSSYMSHIEKVLSVSLINKY